MAKRTGSTYLKDGVRQVAVRTDRPGAKKPKWVRPCPLNEEGLPMDEIEAKALALKSQRAYDTGAWDPWSPTPHAPVDVSSTPKAAPGLTVLEYVYVWLKTLDHESAPKDRANTENYLARSPIASIPLATVSPADVGDFVAWLRRQPSSQGGRVAPRTVRNIYSVLRRALAYAAFQRACPSNPCVLPRGVLPAIVDKVQGARDAWEFTRPEIEQLLADARVPADRRVFNALQFLTGARPGETRALRWQDWDRAMAPLTCLSIRRAIRSVSHVVGRTKTGAKKPVPVHPVLERVLAAWWGGGWAGYMGRAPKPEDLIVPAPSGRARRATSCNRDFRRDLARLELPLRHLYVARHTFITRTQNDGGDGQVLRWVTHAPPSSAYDGYTRMDWSRLCGEVAKLRIAGPETAVATGVAKRPPLVTNRHVPEAPQGLFTG